MMMETWYCISAMSLRMAMTICRVSSICSTNRLMKKAFTATRTASMAANAFRGNFSIGWEWDDPTIIPLVLVCVLLLGFFERAYRLR
jgi:hypothetical protein